MKDQKTKVHFRVWEDGDAIALFPEDLWDQKGNITSYEHTGQHGAAHPSLINSLTPATERQYKNLKKELESAPYNYVLEVLNPVKVAFKIIHGGVCIACLPGSNSIAVKYTGQAFGDYFEIVEDTNNRVSLYAYSDFYEKATEAQYKELLDFLKTKFDHLEILP